MLYANVLFRNFLRNVGLVLCLILGDILDFFIYRDPLKLDMLTFPLFTLLWPSSFKNTNNLINLLSQNFNTSTSLNSSVIVSLYFSRLGCTDTHHLGTFPQTDTF